MRLPYPYLFSASALMPRSGLVAGQCAAIWRKRLDDLLQHPLRVHIDRLDKANLLFLVLSKFCDIDLHPEAVSNLEMGYLYEELVRRFSELSNETAGEHFTPREVIRLMVDLLFIEDDDLLAKPGIKKIRNNERRLTTTSTSAARAKRPNSPPISCTLVAAEALA